MKTNHINFALSPTDPALLFGFQASVTKADSAGVTAWIGVLKQEVWKACQYRANQHVCDYIIQDTATTSTSSSWVDHILVYLYAYCITSYTVKKTLIAHQVTILLAVRSVGAAERLKTRDRKTGTEMHYWKSWECPLCKPEWTYLSARAYMRASVCSRLFESSRFVLPLENFFKVLAYHPSSLSSHLSV